MTDDFVKVVLSAMATAICAMWARLNGIQRKLEDAVKQEAKCQAKLDLLQVTLEQKHEENQAALAALYCKRNPE